MPEASGRHVKYHYRDHDTDLVNEAPPVQNTWYEVFHAQDVRLIWCMVQQDNDEVAAKDIQVRWTIDGTVYFRPLSILSGTVFTVFRNWNGSTGGTDGLEAEQGRKNAGYYVDKRGLDFKVEIRMTAVPGTNQVLICRCVRETLETT